MLVKLVLILKSQKLIGIKNPTTLILVNTFQLPSHLFSDTNQTQIIILLLIFLNY